MRALRHCAPRGAAPFALLAASGEAAESTGPADLAASMGHLANSQHPDVQQTIAEICRICEQAGKAIGIYASDAEAAKRYRGLGIHFIALNADIAWLTRGASAVLNARAGSVFSFF